VVFFQKAFGSSVHFFAFAKPYLTYMNSRYLTVVLLVVTAFAVNATVCAQEMPVPPNVQARFFKKVFGYDKTIPKDQIKLVIVFADASTEAKDDLQEAFTALGVSVTAVKSAQLAQVTGVHIVYVAPGVDVRAVKSYCSNNGVLSITGVVRWVKDGDFSIAIDAVNEQPKVVVNADRLKVERQDAPDLMRLR
jgi:hypothetical protein